MLNHFSVSLVKSIVRIGAGAAFILTGNGLIMTAGALLVIAEILGIVEEIV